MRSRFRYAQILLAILLVFIYSGYSSRGIAASSNPNDPLADGIQTDGCNIEPLAWNNILRIDEPRVMLTLYRKCPKSWRIGYLAAVSLYKSGDLKEAGEVIKAVLALVPGFEPAEMLDKELNHPYQLAFEVAQKHFRGWLNRPLGIAPFSQQKPKQPPEPPLPTLKKGEFEKHEEFRLRVEAESQKRRDKIEGSAEKYKEALKAYNNKVRDYNALKKETIAERNRRAPQVFNKFLSNALHDIFGPPILENLRYEAEAEVFFATLRSSGVRFNHDVIISIPLKYAPRFKENVKRVIPKIRFEKDGNRLELTSMHVIFEDNTYEMTLTDKEFITPIIEERLLAEKSATISIGPALNPEMEDLTDAQRDELLRRNDSYFQNLETVISPQLKDLSKKKEAKEKKLIEQRRIQREQRKVEKKRREIEKIERELAQTNIDEYKGLRQIKVWNFEKKAKNWGEDSVAVIIGNRKYSGLPLDHYAKNDALAMDQFAREALQIPKNNIFYLSNVTKGKLVGFIEGKLPQLVKKRKTKLLFYYSGHGIAVEHDAKILPADTAHTYAKLIGYSRNRLIAKLGTLDARSLLIVLDACYTGQTKRTGQRLMAFKMVTPVAPLTIGQHASNTVIITASQADEVAWSSDVHGMSLMTNYLLEGLKGSADKNKDGLIHSDEIREYLHKHVDGEALAKHDQNQRPMVSGKAQPLVRYR